MTSFQKTILGPEECLRIGPELMRTSNPRVWVYRYKHLHHDWVLSIATHAEPGSHKLSLGGFRIAPKERTSLPGFDSDHEAIDLAIGMEEKVYWSRLMGIGGPLARRDMGRIVGGKCVMKPTPDARVGQKSDFALLDFAIECFKDVEASAGIFLTTGQDLGHGVMSDGKTQSLQYLNDHYKGSVVADTSGPTGEGNFFVLDGMLRALDLPLDHAVVGLIGVGNIGRHIVDRLHAHGAKMLAVESNDARREAVAALGVEVFPANGKDVFLEQPMDALVVNAAGGTLDTATVTQCTRNQRLKVVCGSENLTMPDPNDADRLRAAHKLYCPTELGGMMGYLTAVEEYLAHLEGKPFRIEDMMDAAKRLRPAAEKATRREIEKKHTISFEDAVREVFSAPEPAAR